MPGYANYKTLYKEEYACLKDEGYDVDKYTQPCVDNEEFLPFRLCLRQIHLPFQGRQGRVRLSSDRKYQPAD